MLLTVSGRWGPRGWARQRAEPLLWWQAVPQPRCAALTVLTYDKGSPGQSRAWQDLEGTLPQWGPARGTVRAAGQGCPSQPQPRP